jgi:hypothetical protein
MPHQAEDFNWIFQWNLLQSSEEDRAYQVDTIRDGADALYEVTHDKPSK